MSPVVATPARTFSYGVQGSYVTFDEARVPWVSEVEGESPWGDLAGATYPGEDTYPGEEVFPFSTSGTPGAVTYIAFDETTGPVTADGPYILIEEPNPT